MVYVDLLCSLYRSASGSSLPPGINPKTQTILHYKAAPSRLNADSFLAIQKMKIPQIGL
jgi:hypothetical protein